MIDINTIEGLLAVALLIMMVLGALYTWYCNVKEKREKAKRAYVIKQAYDRGYSDGYNDAAAVAALRERDRRVRGK